MSRSVDKSADGATDSWRARWRRWLRPPRRLAFTTSGKFFVLLTLGIGFGAINTGNNLLFLLLGMMLSLIIASGLLSEAAIRGVEASRSPPRRLFADAPAPGSFTVGNSSKWPSLSIEICEQNAVGECGPLDGRKIGPRRVSWWKFWRLRPRKPAEYDQPLAAAYTLRIGGEQRQQLPATYVAPRRGRYRLPGIEIVTRFPFGLFEKRRELDQPDHLVVFPAPLEVDDWIGSVRSRFGDAPQNRRGAGQDYFGLRDYRTGEDQRLIHWKSSARRGALVVRETEQRDQRAVEVCLLNCTGQPARRRHRVQPAFEIGLRRAAGLIIALLQQDYRVGLTTLDEHVPASDQTTHLDRMLAVLAVADLRDGVHSIPAADPPPADGRARILVGLASATAHAGAAVDLILPFAGLDAADATPADDSSKTRESP